MPRAESLLGGAAALVGAIGIASSLTPEFAGRYRARARRASAGRAECGPGLRARVRDRADLAVAFARPATPRAWQLAVLVVICSAIAHLAKGLDVEEAASTLVPSRGAAALAFLGFTVPGKRRQRGRSLLVGSFPPAIVLVTLSFELRGNDVPDRLFDGFQAAAIVLGFSALFIWLRPLSHAVEQTVTERRGSRGSSSTRSGAIALSFFALRRDESYPSPPARNAFLAYRVVAGAAFDQRRSARRGSGVRRVSSREFQGFAHAHGWRLAVVGALGENSLHANERLGMRAIAIGDEAQILVPRRVRSKAVRFER